MLFLCAFQSLPYENEADRDQEQRLLETFEQADVQEAVLENVVGGLAAHSTEELLELFQQGQSLVEIGLLVEELVEQRKADFVLLEQCNLACRIKPKQTVAVS